MNREEVLHESLARDVLNSGMKGEIKLEGSKIRRAKEVKEYPRQSVRGVDGGYPLETKAGKGRM